MAHPRWKAGQLSTAFIPEEFPDGFHGVRPAATELASQAEQLAEAISFFKVDDAAPAVVAGAGAGAARSIRSAVVAPRPMSIKRKFESANDGGFDFDLGGTASDELDARFKRRDAA